MQAFTSHYIAGNWVAAQTSEIFKVRDSNTGEVIATGIARDSPNALNCRQP